MSVKLIEVGGIDRRKRIECELLNVETSTSRLALFGRWRWNELFRGFLAARALRLN